MTLVLTALTPRYVIQVSDRRVVWRHRSGADTRRDGHVKAVVTQHFACSYTGVADLGGDTAEWLAVLLSDHTEDPDAGIHSVGAAVRAELVRRQLRDQPLDVVFAGWEERDGAFVPMAMVVSNLGPPEASGEPVAARIVVASGRLTAVFPVGQPLTPTELVNVNRDVRRLCKNNRGTPRGLVQILTTLTRSVSRSSDRGPYVSADVLATSFPRHDLIRGGAVIGSLEKNYVSVVNLPDGNSLVERHGGPIIVGREAVIQASPSEDGPHPGELEAVAKIIRKPEAGALVVYILTDPPLGPAWGWPGDARESRDQRQ